MAKVTIEKPDRSRDPAQVKQEAIEAGLPKVGGKQAVGMATIKQPGQKAVTRYELEDQTQVIADEDGNELQKMPGQGA